MALLSPVRPPVETTGKKAFNVPAPTIANAGNPPNIFSGSGAETSGSVACGFSSGACGGSLSVVA